MIPEWHHTFERTGHAVIPVERRDLLDDLRRRVQDASAEHLGVDDVTSLDRLHDLLGDDPDRPDASERLRHHVTARLRDDPPAGRTVFACLRDAVTSLIGPDVLSQRCPNVVLQPPRHPLPTELHRDAPANSAFEVVVWLPLVDCHDTKSMYLLDRDTTGEALDLHRDRPHDHELFDRFLQDRSVAVDVPYGSALLFWTGLLHGSVVNAESTTRISLNTRFKGLMTPFGMKDPYRYFEILTSSPLTRLGLDFSDDRTALQSASERS